MTVGVSECSLLVFSVHCQAIYLCICGDEMLHLKLAGMKNLDFDYQSKILQGATVRMCCSGAVICVSRGFSGEKIC